MTLETPPGPTPSRTSTVLLSACTLAFLVVLARDVAGVRLPMLAGLVGVICLTASLRLLSRGSAGGILALLVSLSTVPVAVGLIAGVFGTTLVLMSNVFPVDGVTLWTANALLIAGNVGVVIGCLLAVLGLTLVPRNVATAPLLDRYFRITLRTMLVPTLLGASLLARIVAFGGAGSETILGRSITGVAVVVLAPQSPHLHLSGFLFVAVLAAASLTLAIRVIPVSAHHRDGEPEASRSLSRLDGALSSLSRFGPIGVALALALELTVPPDSLSSSLGSGLYGPIQAVFHAPVLRGLLLGATLLALVVTGVVAAVRRIARNSTAANRRLASPVVGGVIALLGTILVSSRLFPVLTGVIAELLPEPIGSDFLTEITGIERVYGVGTVFVLLLVGILLTTAVVLLLFRATLAAGYLTETSAGYGLAATGLFLGTVAAGTVDASPLVVFAGIGASLLVWDLGRFGTSLGREIGPDADTRDVELIHASGTLLVGLLGAAGAWGVTGLETAVDVAAVPTTVALLLIGTGVVFLLLAAR